MRKILPVVVLLVGTGLALMFSRGLQLFIVNAEEVFFGGQLVRKQVFDAEQGLSLNVFAPDGAKNAPVAVFFHGGSWQHGHKGQYSFFAVALAKQGIVVALPDYRKYPDVRFPDFVRDGASAVAWVHANIASYGGDPDRIFLVGHSAGGHTAAMLAVDKQFLADAGVPQAAIAGVAGLAGPYHFTPEEPDMQAIFGPPENYPAMQASRFVEGSEPPMLLLYGSDDTVVGAHNHERLAAALTGKGVCHRVSLYDGVDHISIISAFAWPFRSGNPVVEDLTRFIKNGMDTPGCP